MRKNRGYCEICESEVWFIEREEWLRDHYKCDQCGSVPRQRAIIGALNRFCPDWENKRIHESSPCGPASEFMMRKCREYSYLFLFDDTELGDSKNSIRCENLERMTFPSSSFDIFVTQDVFEHVFNPSKAFEEIERVLQPEGVHIFTVPWYPEYQKSICRAKVLGSTVHFIEEPIYHGNPVSEEGALVTFDWGMDFTELIYRYANMHTLVYLSVDRERGLDGEFLHVFLSRKIQV